MLNRNLFLLTGLCFVLSFLATISAFGIFGFSAYAVSYLLAVLACLMFLVFTLFTRQRSILKDMRVTLAQAGCVGIVCLKGAGLSDDLNIWVICAATAVLGVSFMLMCKDRLRLKT